MYNSAKPRIITTSKEANAGTKYWSAIDVFPLAADVAVAVGAEAMFMYVVSDEPQYEFVPLKVAMI